MVLQLHVPLQPLTAAAGGKGIVHTCTMGNAKPMPNKHIVSIDPLLRWSTPAAAAAAACVAIAPGTGARRPSCGWCWPVHGRW
jgi:hypothetical protein